MEKNDIQKRSPSPQGSAGYASDENNDEESLTLRVCSEANQGMRRYMEDELSVVLETETDRNAFLAVYDGHGGKDAPIFAKEHLYKNIKCQPGFNSEDPELVKKAIKDGFWKTHMDMFKAVDSWPKRKDGLNSTSGTTCTVALLRGRKLFIAHVGDSAAVIGEQDGETYKSNDITVDHKPEDPNEKARIEAAGGRVSTTSVPRVVWKRERKDQSLDSPTDSTKPTKYEYVPFLAVSRALGDLWSYDREKDIFIVSPEPDITYTELIPGKHKFLILASDGLWGVMKGQTAVNMVLEYEANSTKKPDARNSAHELVQKSLGLWQARRSRADNITAIVAFLDEDIPNNSDSDSEGSIEQYVDTDTIADTEEEENDTPTDMPAVLKRTDSNNMAMVRQLAFRKFDSSSGKLTVKNVTEAKFSPVNSATSSQDLIGTTSATCSTEENPPLQFAADSDNTSCALDSTASPDEEMLRSTAVKRKSKEMSQVDANSCGSTSNKKPCTDSLRVNVNCTPTAAAEEASPTKLITKISPQSLKDLRFDEDDGFSDGDAETSRTGEEASNSIKCALNLLSPNSNNMSFVNSTTSS